MPKVFIFGAVVFGIQQLQHTGVAFSALFFLFMIVSALTFNIAGGFSRVVGAYVFWFCMLVPIIGVLWKIVINEPADSNLSVPQLTITAYLGAICMLALVAIITTKIDLRYVGFAAKGAELNYMQAAIGCLVFWFFIYFAGMFVYSVVLRELHQIDLFRQLAIILGTIGLIKESNGRRTLGAVNIIPMLLLFQEGLLTFSKQTMMTPLVCWLVAATYMRLRLTPPRLLAIGVFTLISFQVLTPWSQARDLIPGDVTLGERWVRIGYYFTHFGEVRKHVQEIGSNDLTGMPHHYYNSSQNGLVERLSMISSDDALFNYATLVPPLGMAPIYKDFANWVPNFIHQKEYSNFGTGNYYAHLVGGYLAATDETTGISFSPVSEAYLLEGWFGVLLLLPAIWLLLFLSIDFVCGDVRQAPWALLVIVYFAHAAPESLVSGLIYYMWYGNFGLFVAIVFCTQLAPVLGALFHGSNTAAPVPMAVLRARPS